MIANELLIYQHFHAGEVVTVLTPKCPSFQGPLEVDCLMSIWLDVGCTRDGEKAPVKLTESQKAKEWKTYNLK